MEWIKIGQNKIKVMLSAEDAARYALSPTCEEKGELAGQAFRAILSDVRDAADFDASEDKVYVQLYPSRTGGFELFITKLGVELEGNGTERPPTYKKSVTRTLSLSLQALPSLIAVCRRLLERGFSGESAVYLDDAHRYWLLLTDKGAPALTAEDYRFAREYGEIESADTAKLLLTEHGRCICKAQAVEKIGIL